MCCAARSTFLVHVEPPANPPAAVSWQGYARFGEGCFSKRAVAVLLPSKGSWGPVPASFLALRVHNSKTRVVLVREPQKPRVVQGSTPLPRDTGGQRTSDSEGRGGRLAKQERAPRCTTQTPSCSTATSESLGAPRVPNAIRLLPASNHIIDKTPSMKRRLRLRISTRAFVREHLEGT